MVPLKIGDYKGYVLYPYEELFRKALYAFKGCYDYELKDIFITRQLPLLKLLYRDWSLFPAASSVEGDKKRGFNHVQEIFAPLGEEMLPLLRKRGTHKQSDLSLEERAKISSFLSLEEKEKVRGKKALFVDDVVTSGNTLKASLDLLKEAGARKLSFLVLAHVSLKREEAKKEGGFFAKICSIIRKGKDGNH